MHILTLGYIRHFVEMHSYIAYLFLILGVIVEGEVAVILAGIFSNLGSLHFFIALLATIVGGVLKSIIGYSLGVYLQKRHSNLWIIKQAEHKIAYFFPHFNDRPFWSIFLSRFLIIGLYWFTLIYAGYKKVRIQIFAQAEAASLAIWSVVMLSIGFFFSYTALIISQDIRNFLLTILACFLAFFIIERIVGFVISLVTVKEDAITKE